MIYNLFANKSTGGTVNLIAPVICLAFAGVSVVLWRRLSRARREAYIRDFILPQGLFDKLRARHPHFRTLFASHTGGGAG
jgi:hypothetical protein